MPGVSHWRAYNTLTGTETWSTEGGWWMYTYVPTERSLPPELSWQKPLDLSRGFRHLSPTLDTKAGHIAWKGEYNVTHLPELYLKQQLLASVLNQCFPGIPGSTLRFYCYFKLMLKMVYTNYKPRMHTSDGNVTSEKPKQIKTNKCKIKEKLFLGRSYFLCCFLDITPFSVRDGEGGRSN